MKMKRELEQKRRVSNTHVQLQRRLQNKARRLVKASFELHASHLAVINKKWQKLYHRGRELETLVLWDCIYHR